MAARKAKKANKSKKIPKKKSPEQKPLYPHCYSTWDSCAVVDQEVEYYLETLSEREYLWEDDEDFEDIVEFVEAYNKELEEQENVDKSMKEMFGDGLKERPADKPKSQGDLDQQLQERFGERLEDLVRQHVYDDQDVLTWGWESFVEDLGNRLEELSPDLELLIKRESRYTPYIRLSPQSKDAGYDILAALKLNEDWNRSFNVIDHGDHLVIDGNEVWPIVKTSLLFKVEPLMGLPEHQYPMYGGEDSPLCDYYEVTDIEVLGGGGISDGVVTAARQRVLDEIDTLCILTPVYELTPKERSISNVRYVDFDVNDEYDYLFVENRASIKSTRKKPNRTLVGV